MVPRAQVRKPRGELWPVGGARAMKGHVGAVVWLGRALRLFEEGGPRHLLARGVAKAASPLLAWGSIRFFAFFAREPVGGLGEPHRGPILQVREASAMELIRLVAGCDPRRSAEVLGERLQRGDRCFVAAPVSGGIVSSCWVTTSRGHIPELEMDVILRPREAYIYDAFTQEQLRATGAFGAVRDQICRRLGDEGFGRIHFYVQGDNRQGLQGARHWARETGWLFYVRWRAARALVAGRRGPDMPELARRGSVS